MLLFFRQGNGSFGPEQVDPSLCTHIIYSWANLDPKTYKLVPGIPELDIENDFYGKIAELKQTGVKVILGAGGLKDSEDDKWKRMASTHGNRKIFIDSLFDMLHRWNFDGVQIAWQYPVCKQVDNHIKMSVQTLLKHACLIKKSYLTVFFSILGTMHHCY